MNILKKELKQGLKPFLFWLAGIGFLILGGMVKFTGVQGAGSGSMSDILGKIPKPVLAIFGMSEVNIESFGGFFSVLQFYALIAVCCYAVYLGTSCVLRESVDKTYEFLFTKPCGRLHILSIKMISGMIYLVLIIIMSGVFSYMAPVIYNIENTISAEMILFPAAMLLISLFFFSLSMALSALFTRSERAVQSTYGLLLFAYALSVVFDMDTKFEIVRFLTPFKYFRSRELVSGQLNVVYVFALILMSGVLLAISFRAFARKDLIAA
ncbi:hypothetical protein SDC9_93684 [bioreactor metagenome]|uniref:ABC-2 type transporter domain-containing protein n=1 Tax=bioreactor metagenome TaxID=1076179 RepID=A0A645A1N5_9ZZZZ|nr:ABC transporter permease subunit [Oscillospiraceae bacterium]